jgi:transposase
VQYTYERDYTFRRNQQVSIGTLNGRVAIPYQGYDEHTALIRHGATIGDAKLWYDKPKKTFYVLVSLEIDGPEPTYEQLNEVVGVDVGIRYLAVTSPSRGKAIFHPGKRVRHQANHYARLRKRLQKKGTRGAKRRLKRIEQRERRLKLQANRVYSQWSFAELHALLSYKATLAGSRAIKVDADYTSQTCPMCGYRSEENRPQKGLLFVCHNPECRYRLHADLVGARNVTMRTLLVRQDWIRTGTLSMCPDASDKEAKAARLARYAELRWSPDASLRSESGGH